MKQHIVSLLVSNHFGVLMRVTTIFTRRTCNIKSLTVAETENRDISRITILMEGSDEIAYTIEKLLARLEDVKKVAIFPIETVTNRELLLVKIKNTNKSSEFIENLSLNSCRILDKNNESAIIEMTGNLNEITEFINSLGDFDVIEICRTGVSSLSPGNSSIYEI